MQKELTQAKLMPILALSSRSSASSTAHNSEVTTMEGEGESVLSSPRPSTINSSAHREAAVGEDGTYIAHRRAHRVSYISPGIQ